MSEEIGVGEGTEQVLARLARRCLQRFCTVGDIIGGVACLSRRTHEHNATACKQTEVAVFPRVLLELVSTMADGAPAQRKRSWENDDR